MQLHSLSPLNTVILKVSSRCNLNCSYCYVYNKEDQTWRNKPKRMSDEVFSAVLERTAFHATQSGQKSISLTFHGGEPTLVGLSQMRKWMEEAKSKLGKYLEVRFKLQTNGTLLDKDWATLFAEFNVNVGISMDGPPLFHDKFRVDHHGNGSYALVERGLKYLQDSGVSYGILSVIQLDCDPITVYRHFRSLGCDSISFLLPDYSHSNIGEVRSKFGLTPCADYLIEIFTDWWTNAHTEIRIRNFWTILKLLMGGSSQSDTFGNDPFGFLIVESDGEIEGLDCLRVCDEGITKTGANVLRNDFSELKFYSPFQYKVIFEGISKPDACCGCPEEDTCGGGYLPHRYSHENGFNNPSVWCQDIIKLFKFIRDTVDIPYSETLLRREALRQLSEETLQQKIKLISAVNG